MAVTAWYNLSDDDRQLLLKLARQSISYYLAQKKLFIADTSSFSTALQQQAASFVTLTLDGKLRGCIGTTEAYQPLVDDVIAHAHGAAFRDPRFAALQESELDNLVIEISVLTQPEIISAESSSELVEMLKPGVDGLILEQGGHRATFLPSVWKQLPSPEQFVMQLQRKAGIPANIQNEKLRAWRYRTLSFAEKK